MSLAALMALGIAIFFIGWLLSLKDPRGSYVAGAGAVIYLVAYVINVVRGGL